MNQPLPIHLLLDEEIRVEVGRRGLLRWAVLNTSGFPIDALMLTAHGVDGPCKVEARGLDGHVMQPQGWLEIAQPIRVEESGFYGIRFTVSGCLQGGQRFMLGSGDVAFNFRAKGEGPSVTIKGGDGVLIPGEVSAARLNIRSENGIINIQEGLDCDEIHIETPRGINARGGIGQRRSNFVPFDINKAVEITLHHRPLDGLFELDFTRMAADWRGGGAGDLAVSFIDEAGRPLSLADRERHAYRVQVSSRRAGYLSLFALGDEGVFYQLAPCELSDTLRIAPGSPLVFPDDFLSLPDPRVGEGQVVCFEFTQTGVEQVLALVSQEPIPPAPLLAQLTSGRLRELLRFFNGQPSVVACAEVKVI